jgi:hypothetical protein
MPDILPQWYEYTPDPNLKSLPAPAYQGDRAKAVITGKRPICLVTDVDCLFVRRFEYEPPNDSVVLAMPVKWMPDRTTDTDGSGEWANRVLWSLHQKLGLTNVEPVTTLPWVIWARADMLPLFEEELPRVVKAIDGIERGKEFGLTIAVWHFIWHRLRKQGKADILPGNYVLHFPVYPLPRRLEIARQLWEKICNADQSRE